MPTKLNSAGQQQNYIPAGNGEGSGEYGDNATGSNKHFEVFEKNVKRKDSAPIKKAPPKTQEYDEKTIKEKLNTKGYKTKTIAVIIDKMSSPNFDPQCKNLIVDILGSRQYDIKATPKASGYYSPFTWEISFSSETDNANLKGYTFAHELGHAIDYGYGISKLQSQNYISKKYGKSLIDMKNEEFEKFMNNGGYEQMIEEYRKDNEVTEEIKALQNEIFDSKNIRMKKLNNDEEYKKNREENEYSFNSYLNGQISYSEYETQRKNIEDAKQKIIQKIEQQYPKISTQQIREKEKKFVELRQQQVDYINQKYTSFSDMCQAYQENKKFNGGHKKGYFWEGKKGENASTELFAELFGAIAINNKEALKLYERYIPKTLDISREIVKLLKF